MYVYTERRGQRDAFLTRSFSAVTQPGVSISETSGPRQRRREKRDTNSKELSIE